MELVTERVAAENNDKEEGKDVGDKKAVPQQTAFFGDSL